jgi:hypothetical protein
MVEAQDLYEVWKKAMEQYEPSRTFEPWYKMSVSEQAAWELVAEEAAGCSWLR